MTKSHKSEALRVGAVIETYAVHELKFEEKFENDHEKNSLSQMTVKQMKLSNWSVRCVVPHYFILSYIINTLVLITGKHYVS